MKFLQYRDEMDETPQPPKIRGYRVVKWDITHIAWVYAPIGTVWLVRLWGLRWEPLAYLYRKGWWWMPQGCRLSEGFLTTPWTDRKKCSERFFKPSRKEVARAANKTDIE